MADLEGLDQGAVFNVLIKDGRLSELEGVTFTEPWPAETTRFELSYIDGEERSATMAELDDAVEPGGDQARPR